MNPPTDPPPPPPPQPHRPSSSSCDLHPEEHFSGFCPSCLFERLTTLDQSSASAPSSSSRRPSTSSSAAAAIRALFKANTTNTESIANTKSKSKPPSFFPELRRTQSFSASKNEGFSGVFEPQRKSCDVRARNGNSTLWSLFSTENELKSSQNHHLINADSRNLGGSASNSVARPVIESKEEDENDDEIRVLEEPNAVNVVEESSGEIIEEDLKTMKDHIDIDSQPKKQSASFWSAASVFSKKWQKWRRKQKVKKTTTGGESSALPAEKPISRQFRETQSEIADYGFGRRSCDMDPRFSLDAGRISFDDPRYSFDEPRASWDGHMIGRTFPRLPPMLSVVEDAPAPAVHVSRSDAYIPVEESQTMNSVNKEEIIPGGSIQTKEYYADSSSRRRKSFDRSNSIRRTAAAIVAGIDETKANSNSNSKVSPAIDSFSGAKNNFINPLKDDSSGPFGSKENASINGIGERKEMKKSRKWNWNIWGFIQKRGNGNGVINRDEEEERYNRGNRIGIERSYSQSWQETRGENAGYNPRMNRSNSSVSWRNLNDNGVSFSSGRKSNVDANDNGFARFYLGPLNSSRRSGGWKSKPNVSSSVARNALRMY